MAAYRRVDDLTVTCRLTACTPGSALGPTLSIEYGKAFTFLPFYCLSILTGKNCISNLLRCRQLTHVNLKMAIIIVICHVLEIEDTKVILTDFQN